MKSLLFRVGNKIGLADRDQAIPVLAMPRYLPNRPDSNHWIFDPGDSQNPHTKSFFCLATPVRFQRVRAGSQSIFISFGSFGSDTAPNHCSGSG
jgi:hypothetical protein